MSHYKGHILLLCLFVSLQTSLIPQVNFQLNTKVADSLEQILPSISGKEKVDAINEISLALIRHYSNRSDSMASLAIDLASDIDYRKGLAKAYFCKGTNDYINGDFIEAITILYDALELYQKIADTNMMIETYYQIGAVAFFSLTDLAEGLRCVQKCLDYAKASGYKHWEAQMYSSFQYLYYTAGNHEKALEYLKRYTAFASEMSVPRLEEAMVISAYGRSYSQKGDYRNALNKYLETWPRINANDIEERAYLSQLTYSIGEAYSNLGFSDSAFYYYQLGMILAKKNKHYWGSMMNSLGLARQYLILNEIKNSEQYCDSTIYFGSQIDSLSSFYGIREYSRLLGMSGELYIPLNKEFKRFLAWRVMSGSYQILMQIYEKQGQFENTLIVLRSLERIEDSIANFQKRTEILDLQYKYQTSQKDNQIMMLSQENQLQSFRIRQNRFVLFAVIVFVALVVLILLLVSRQSRIRSKEQVAEFKQKLLRSQMNPHFIFNSLTSVQNFIISHDEIKASIYLSRFSDLVRSILNNSLVEQITVEEEISTIENYLELQKVRFPEKFDYSLEMDEKIDPENTFIPPMLAQPFIENSIEHGFKRKESKGNINITFKQLNKILYLEIEDDGIGRLKAQEILKKIDKDHKSLATTITLERIKVLNKKQKRKISLTINDIKNDQGEGIGTLVVFEVPLPGGLIIKP